jgi:hypothetical protein
MEPPAGLLSPADLSGLLEAIEQALTDIDPSVLEMLRTRLTEDQKRQLWAIVPPRDRQSLHKLHLFL